MKLSKPSQRWVEWGIPAAILLLNIIYKILFLGSRDITIDEPFTLFYSQMPIREIMYLLPGENNPPLHFLLMHAWINLVGIEPFQARLLSLIFGAFSAVLIYLVGIRNFSRSVGISAALLLTFSNFNTYIAQEARVYSLFVFLSILSVLLFLELIKKFKTRLLIGLIVVNILLIYSHFFAFWILVLEYSFILVFKDLRKRLFRPFLFMAAVLLIAFLPYLSIFIGRFLASSGGTWLEPPTLSSLYNLLWKFCNQPVPTVGVIVILSLGLGKYLFSVIKGNSVSRTSVLFLVAWFLLPTLLTFLISFALPLFYEKYLVFISPAIYLLIGVSVESLSASKAVRYGTFLLLLTAFIATSTPRPYDSKSITLMIRDIEDLNTNKDPIVITPGYFDKTFIYHYNREWFKDYQRLDETMQNNHILPILDPSKLIPEEMNSRKQLFLIEAGSQYLDPSGAVLQNLKSQADSIEVIEYDNVLKLYILRKGNN
ncbi:glycosyltransferase family 39 protein [Bacteroidota bacterium]